MAPLSRSNRNRRASKAALSRRRRWSVSWAAAALVSLAVLAALLVSLARAPSAVRTQIVRFEPDMPAASPGATSTPGIPAHQHGDFGVPKRLRIPRIGIDARIVSVGLTGAGAMAAPDGAFSVGWFKFGPRPGQSGSSVLDGHSGMASGDAVFDLLPSLRKGDRVYVADASNTSVTFVVTGRRLYAPDEKAEAVFAQGGSSRLNLITCTGTWDSVKKTHTERLVVFTEAVF
jgi:LPXTG-site transpeptidase (sortase) family protein